MIYSLNQGQSWNQATWNAAWSARSNFAYATQPGTNFIIMTGGNTAGGQVWASWDGIGAQWTMMAASTPYLGAYNAAIVFLYDTTPSPSPTSGGANCTLIYYDPTSPQQYVYSSTNLGVSFTVISTALNGVANLQNNQPKLVADAENYLYLIASANSGDNSGIWFSNNKGFNWALMNYADSSFAVSGIFSLTSFTWGAAALRYTSTSSSAPGGYHRQLILYGSLGGTTEGPETGYACISPATPVTSNGYSSAVIEIVFPNETLVNSELLVNNTQPLPAVGQPVITFHDPVLTTAPTALPLRAWPECGQSTYHIYEEHVYYYLNIPALHSCMRW